MVAVPCISPEDYFCNLLNALLFLPPVSSSFILSSVSPLEVFMGRGNPGSSPYLKVNATSFRIKNLYSFHDTHVLILISGHPYAMSTMSSHLVLRCLILFYLFVPLCVLYLSSAMFFPFFCLADIKIPSQWHSVKTFPRPTGN